MQTNTWSVSCQLWSLWPMISISGCSAFSFGLGFVTGVPWQADPPRCVPLMWQILCNTLTHICIYIYKLYIIYIESSHILHSYMYVFTFTLHACKISIYIYIYMCTCICTQYHMHIYSIFTCVQYTHVSYKYGSLFLMNMLFFKFI